MVATPVFVTLQHAIELVHKRTGGRRTSEYGATPELLAIVGNRAVTRSAARHAVKEIAEALASGSLHAQGAVPNGVGRFEDIPIQFWQYADLDVERSITGGRSPITERSHAMPVLCYDRLIFFREEIDKVWPVPPPASGESVMPASVVASLAETPKAVIFRNDDGAVTVGPIPPADRACDRRPWWRRIFG